MVRGFNYMLARKRITLAIAAAAISLSHRGSVVWATDVSSPVILQDFENQYSTIENRMADVFNAGYGSIYLPPPGRADSGNQSVGYDQYDRFDLGSAGNPTLYGTQEGLKALVAATHTMGGLAYVDLVWNHSGFSDSSTGSGSFAAAGGYPGFALTLQTSTANTAGYNTQGYNLVDGDYHSAYANTDQTERLAGLVDIAQETNNQFIRNPVTLGDSRNIPGPVITGYTTAGAPIYASYNGRTANVPTASNVQYYPDQTLTPKIEYDPNTGETITVYPFNTTDPTKGTPVPENGLGYLMRNAQWLIQDIGVDGFRMDAAKEMPTWVFNYLDRAVYNASNRYLLNGQRENIFSFSEVYTSDVPTLESYILKNINPSTPNTIGGNRDVLDYGLYFAMDGNLTSNGLNNDWNNIVNSSINYAENGTHDGSYGVSFVSNQDNTAPYLSNVAYAYTLLQPGNAIVYYNGHEFGDNRSFPDDGRGDALGGVYGTALTTLVDLRNRYGRGNYSQADLEKESFAYERDDSMVVLLSNRLDAGYDSRTLDVHFAPGTPLIELTGNAASASIDPRGDIPQLLVVNADSSSPTGASINVRFLRNSSYNSSGGTFETDSGYLVYGPATPQGSMSIGGTSSVMAGGTPAATSTTSLNYANGTTRLSNIDVITGGTFSISLNTIPVNLLGYLRDKPADGDNANFKIDGGIDVNGLGLDTTPGDVSYGFEQFAVSNPGYANASGFGSFTQVVNTGSLSDGYHYITVDAFRERNAGEPAIYSDWKQVIYVDRSPPVAAFNAANPTVYTNDGSIHYDQENFVVRSVDELANSVHEFLDLPIGTTNAQILAMVSSSNQATQTDRNLFQLYQSGVTKGNHVITTVTYKPDGNYSIQRFVGINTNSSPIGAAMGDAVGQYANTPDGYIEGNDVLALYNAIKSGGTTFYPEDDFNGDGQMTVADWTAFGQELHMFQDLGTENPSGQPLVSQGTINYYNSLNSSVPEPLFGTPLVAAIALLSRRRKRRRNTSQN